MKVTFLCVRWMPRNCEKNRVIVLPYLQLEITEYLHSFAASPGHFCSTATSSSRFNFSLFLLGCQARDCRLISDKMYRKAEGLVFTLIKLYLLPIHKFVCIFIYSFVWQFIQSETSKLFAYRLSTVFFFKRLHTYLLWTVLILQLMMAIYACILLVLHGSATPRKSSKCHFCIRFFVFFSGRWDWSFEVQFFM